MTNTFLMYFFVSLAMYVTLMVCMMNIIQSSKEQVSTTFLLTEVHNPLYGSSYNNTFQEFCDLVKCKFWNLQYERFTRKGRSKDHLDTN